MKYWLHRISHYAELSYPLLERGILSIGFSDFSNKSFLTKCANNKEQFEKEIYSTWGSAPRTRSNLWRYISFMNKGDIVLVPIWGREFSIFEIVDDECMICNDLDISNLRDSKNNVISREDSGKLICKAEKEYEIDLGFFRKVKPIVLNVSRSKFADSALTARMKIRFTNADITDLQESVKESIVSFKEKRPINLHSLIMESNLENTLAIIKGSLNPDKVERLVEWYFEKIGASDVDIPLKNEKNKEGDADVIATFESIKTIIYAQVKKHEGLTGTWALEQIEAYKEYKENIDDGYSKIAWVISTADDFTPECYEKAKVNGIQLINGKELTRMLIEVGISGLNEKI